MVPSEIDVLIVGAGLSGIAAAYHLQKTCPGKSYAIFESRDRLGGTWDLFKYPGIRSDSDMFTLGYSFRPWTDAKAIADGPSILAYVQDTAKAYGIDEKICFGVTVVRAVWSTAAARWTVETHDTKSGETTRTICQFLFMCTGYYRYDHGYTPEIAGRERYRGHLFHPQHWPEDLDYEGKRVVVIGSGATAVTLVPELAKRAAHVTMLQRSPTYVMTRPSEDPVANWLRSRLPAKTAYAATRWKNVLMGTAFYAYCRRFPDSAKRLLVGEVQKLAGRDVDVPEHFTPTYAPWDQRLCLVPDEDLFVALREGRASMVTDHIETFTETGLRLKSGRELEADIVVTATGLELLFLGGIALEVDGRQIDPAKTMSYKGLMLSDVPNLGLAIGYTNASWTLKCELSSEFFCRVIEHMDRRGLRRCVPRRSADVAEEPILDLSSGYVRRSIDRFPRQGSRSPWKVHQNYALDRLLLRHSPIEDGILELTP